MSMRFLVAHKWRTQQAPWIIVVIGFLLLSHSDPGAAQITFEASVDRARVTKDQPIQLALTIRSSENLPHVPAPQIALAGFEAYGPTVSTQVEFVNGATNFTRTLTYSLYPLRTGTFTIGPASLELDGRRYETKAIAVEVLKQGTQQQNAKGGGGAEGSETIEDYLFLRATAGRQRAYLGQQVSLEYDLLYRTQVHDVTFKSVPSFTGFWFKTLFIAKQLDPKREMIGDVAFNSTPLRKVALFPTTAGRQKVEAFEITCSVPQQSRSRGRRRLADAFSFLDGFGRSQSLILRSQEIDLEVLPLPEAGRPEPFSGAVGDYDISISARPRSVAVGDPVTVVLEISGTGNIGAVTMPPLPELDGFEVYEPKRSLVEEAVAGQYGGKVAFEYILIPQHSGDLEIPSASFNYFDPIEGQFHTVQSDRIRVESHGDSPDEQHVAYGLTRAEIEAVGEDIRHIKPDATALDRSAQFSKSRIYWAMHIIAPLGYGALYLFHRQRRRLVGDVAYARRRRARRTALSRLGEADRGLADGHGSAVCASVHEAIVGFVADQSNRSAAGLSADECVRLVSSWGAAAPAAHELNELLRLCELQRYAPGAARGAELRQLHDRAGQLISDLGALRV